MGPAWVISAVACGPATLASVSIAGANYSYAMLWVVVLSAVFGTTAQYLAAKISILENRGIIATTEERLGKIWAWILTLYALLFDMAGRNCANECSGRRNFADHRFKYSLLGNFLWDFNWYFFGLERVPMV